MPNRADSNPSLSEAQENTPNFHSHSESVIHTAWTTFEATAATLADPSSETIAPESPISDADAYREFGTQRNTDTAHPKSSEGENPTAKERENYEDLPPEMLDSAYYNSWRQMAITMCAIYVRRYPDRMLKIQQSEETPPLSCKELMRAYTDDDLLFSQEAFREENELLDKLELYSLDGWLNIMIEFNKLRDKVRSAAKRQHYTLAIDRIILAFGLSEQEALLLMMVALSEMDEPVLRCMMVAAGHMTRKKFSASFYAHVCGFDRYNAEMYLSCLSDRSQLIRMRLILPEQPYGYSGTVSRAFSELAVDQRVLDAIRGADLTANLSPHMHYYEKPQRPQSLTLPKTFTREFKLALAMPKARIVITGEPHSGRLTATCAYAKSILKKSVISVDFIAELETLPESVIESHFRDALREALLLNAIILIRFDELKTGSLAEHVLDNLQPPLSRHIAYYPGTIVVTTKRMSPRLSKLFDNPIECHIPLPTQAEQEKVWREALTGIFDEEDLSRVATSFANNYQLTVGQILTTVKKSLDGHDLRLGTDPEAKLESHHILEEIRQCFSHDLESLADVVLSDVPIKRVILPEATEKTIQEILDFARYQRKVLDEWGYRKCSSYGNSLSILFSGPPGTGKTLLATAMANELGKILYRVDLSRIVDKYVGETEKNLAKIFDEASKAQAILLFDEADALFAKRTDVKSSNDRYANLEVNFLIQKLESYQGISILTTNLQTSIDEAFKRRLRYIVEFKDPNSTERARLWKALIAPNTPLKDDIKWNILADNFELSGGHIRNATLNASIRAAANHTELGMQYLLEAAIAETQKLGKLVKLSDKILLMLDDYGVEI